MSTIADKSVSLLTIIGREGWFTTKFWLRASRGAGQLSLTALPAALVTVLLRHTQVKCSFEQQDATLL